MLSVAGFFYIFLQIYNQRKSDIMVMTIIMIVFYIVLLGSALAVGRWLENHEKGWRA